MRPALILAVERLHSAFMHLEHGLRMLTGIELDKHGIFHLPCFFEAITQAADVADLIPTCLRCEVSPAAEGDNCNGCHDFIGERQDERGAP